MNINVKLFANLRTERFDTKSIEIPDNCSIKMVCNETGISVDQKLIILVNGRHAELDNILSDGDSVAIFPAIGGG